MINKRLGDILEFQRGFDLPSQKRIKGSYPIISSSGITDYHNEWKLNNENVITGRYGTIGEIFYYNGKCWALNTTLFVKDFKDNYIKYIYYLLKIVLKKEYGDNKSAVPGVNRNDLHDLIIPYINNNNLQKEIVKPLIAIDNKINLNNTINAELEHLAKTLYNYWFFQFDFPNAKGKPFRASGGKMEYSDVLKREIPKGWEVKRIKDICRIKSGYPFSSESYVNKGKYRLVTIKNVQEDGVNLNVDSFIDVIPENMLDYCLLQPGDILMSLTGNVGRIGLMYDDNCLLNQRVAVIKPFSDDVNEYCYFLLKNEYIRSTIDNLASGSSQANLSPIDTENILLPFNLNVVNNFNAKVSPIVQQIVAFKRENKELIELRDFLLPLLMNGQVRVNNTIKNDHK